MCGSRLQCGEKGIEEWPVKAGRELRLLCALAGLAISHWGMVLGTYWEHIGEMSCAGWLLWDRPCSAFFLLCKGELPSMHAHPCAVCPWALPCSHAPLHPVQPPMSSLARQDQPLTNTVPSSLLSAGRFFTYTTSSAQIPKYCRFKPG